MLYEQLFVYVSLNVVEIFPAILKKQDMFKQQTTATQWYKYNSRIKHHFHLPACPETAHHSFFLPFSPVSGYYKILSVLTQPINHFFASELLTEFSRNSKFS